MTLMGRARDAVERRLRRIEDALRRIEGLRVERRGVRVTATGHGLRRRWLEEAQLRFVGRGR